MDKYEYELRLNEINDLIDDGLYEDAAHVADSIDWSRMRSVTTLCRIGEVYRKNERYVDARDILLRAYDRQPSSVNILYALCDLEIILDELVRALQFYNEFIRVAPNDPRRYILNYMILRARNLGADGMISALEKYNSVEHRPKWAYELAQLYYQTEQDTKCIAQCDETIAFFGEGMYVFKALSLKRMLTELTPEQEAAYQSYFAAEEPEEPQEPEAAPVQEPAPVPGYTDEERYYEAIRDAYPEDVTEEYPSQEQYGESVYEAPYYADEEYERGEEQYGRGKEESADSWQEEEPAPVSGPEEEEEQESVSAAEEPAEPENPADTAEVPEVSGPEDVPDATQVIHQEQLQKVLEEAAPKPEEKKENPYERITTQEIGGQITMTFAGTTVPERQITGQIDLSQVMAEWEQIRQDTAQKHTEEVRRKLKQDTGPLLRELEENLKHGKLEEVEDEVARRELREQREIPEGTEIGNSETVGRKDSLVMEPAATRLWDPADIRNELHEGTGLVDVIPNDTPAAPEAPKQESAPAPAPAPVPAPAPKPEPPRKPLMEDLSATATLDAYEEELRLTTDYEKEDDEVKRAEAAIFAAFEEEEPEKASEPEQKEVQEVPAAAEPVLQEEPVPVPAPAPKPEPPVAESFLSERAIFTEELPDDLPEEEPGEQEAYEEREERPARAKTIPHMPESDYTMQIPQDEYEDGYGDEEESYEEADYNDDETDQIPVKPARRAVREEREEREPEEYTEPEEPEEGPAEEDADEESDGQDQEPEREQRRERRRPAATDQTDRRHRAAREAARMKVLYGASFSLKENRTQIREAVSAICLPSDRGNLILTGPEEKDTLQVAKGILREVKDREPDFVGKVARTTGPVLNRKDIARALAELEQGALIIDDASALREDSVDLIIKELKKEDRGMIVILTDRRRNMDHFLEHNAALLPLFGVRVDLQALDGNALVEYAKNYANSLDYSIDDYGALALASRIAASQSNDHQVTVEEVREMVDEAIRYANRKTPGRLMDVITRKRYDADDMIILREKDFTHY